MAQLKYGPIITSIKGKIGGVVFQGGRGAQQAKLDAIRDSAKLTKADAGRVINTLPITASVAGMWRNLTDEQRTSWNTGAVNYPAYNKFGEAYTPSGFQVFMTLNFQLVALSIGPSDLCPIPVTVPDLPDFGVAWVPSSTINVTFSIAIEADFSVRVEATQPMAVGRNPKNSNYKAIRLMDDTDTSPTNVYSDYVNVFGGVPAGARIYFRFTYYSNITGQKGVPLVIILNT